MKQLFAAVLACLAVFFAGSCASVDPAYKYPDMVADMDPVSAGAVDAEFDRMFSSKLNKVPVDVLFYPRYNTVALEFRHEFVRYRQFWTEEGRKQFADALNRYKEDYAERNLPNKNYGKTRAVYGKVKGAVEWETFKYTTTHKGSPNIDLGYRRFKKDNSVYFSVLMRSAKDEEASGDGANIESLQISMYFTRAQAEELASLFDQTFLLGLVGSRANSGGSGRSAPPAGDPYNEGGF